MKYIYSFHDDCEDKSNLGNKGANLVTMTRLGLPVPPGFIVSVHGYSEYKKSGCLFEEEIRKALVDLEKQMNAKLGKGLQVSVRSSAAVSMPGMMDTVLNINDWDDMKNAIKRVFDSWDNQRAIEYRQLNNITSDLGTAVVVQVMVFGNKDTMSGTGVVFSRDTSTGEKILFGEYIDCAQGEDLVCGARTPVPLSQLQIKMPEVYKELEKRLFFLEKHYRDIQDVEFTIESQKLYILQTRSAKRSGQAAVKAAVDMVHEGLVTRDEAILRLTANDLRALLHKRIKSTESQKPITSGLAAAPGAASGQIVFTVAGAEDSVKNKIPCILVRPETSPADIKGVAASEGLLTAEGGLSSHAALVTRGMGKPCVCGARDIKIDLEKELFLCEGQILNKGDAITIDGTSGLVYAGLLPLEEAKTISEFEELLKWMNEAKRLGVRANADTPDMVAQAIKLGAEGIGLCRTERQFNGPERISAIREYIMAETAEQQTIALERLGKLQKADFIVLFKGLKGLPIIIRLLDPPLHEFLPSEAEVKDAKTKQRIAELKEINPMLGHRGVRLAITNPNIYKMQIEAIEAAKREASIEVPVNVSVMVPQVITPEELIFIKENCAEGSLLEIGTMMETVRICLRASRVAEVAAFLSFGTNDLTQATLSFSREDAEKKFLSKYLETGILKDNPFEVIDEKGVGELMKMAILEARKAKKNIQIGVCGEHAGEPQSISFFDSINIDYVSCSPFRVPIAKLVAAQSALRKKGILKTG